MENFNLCPEEENKHLRHYLFVEAKGVIDVCEKYSFVVFGILPVCTIIGEKCVEIESKNNAKMTQ